MALAINLRRQTGHPPCTFYLQPPFSLVLWWLPADLLNIPCQRIADISTYRYDHESGLAPLGANFFSRAIAVAEARRSKAHSLLLLGTAPIRCMCFVFADRNTRGLIDGVTTLELDNGITKVLLLVLFSTAKTQSRQDGVVIVWHDEEVTPEKCIDTAPVVCRILSSS